MKKIISLLLILTMAVFCFASCGSSKKDDEKSSSYKMSDFEKNLEKEDYEVEVTDDEDEIEEMFEMLNLDYSDYKVKEILVAYNEDGESVTIIKCGSEKNADKLSDDMKDSLEDLEDLLGDTMQIKVEGSFVLIGTKTAINAAKGSSTQETQKEQYKISDFETNLEDEDYTITLTSNKTALEAAFDIFDINYKDYEVKELLYGVNEDGDYVTIIRCSTAKNAKTLNEAIEEINEELDSTEINEIIGSFILLGTRNGINAAKG